ncbi:MAG TPA: D-alanyl-D-alanine carboxypeptidase [Thermomicrobiales bacterium]|nr:D-alanyl-D-alanine carboxypeptidase [Thermomicrobiales bacterium]
MSRRADVTLVVTLLVAIVFPFPAHASPARLIHPPHTSPLFEHGATAAIVVDLTTGIELYDHNADAPAPPASTMKVVTALVASELLPLEMVVTIAPSDLLDTEAYSVMGLLAGDEVTVHALLHGLLMPSGGDAALALARAAGAALDPTARDPIQRFVTELNAYAASIGMRHTHYTNPIGADEPGPQHSSARDLALATQALLDDWLLARIVASRYAVVEVGGPNARAIELFSTNLFLERDDVFGIKTGTDDGAGQCLIAGFWRGDNQILTVVLGSTDRYADTQSLMDEVDAHYRWVALGAGARSAGATDVLAASGMRFMIRRTVVMTAGQSDQLDWELRLNDSAVGDHVGVVRFTIGEREVARIPVY